MKPGYGAEYDDSERHQQPLKRCEDVVFTLLGFKMRRKLGHEGERNNAREYEAEHRDNHQVTSDVRKTVRKHRVLKRIASKKNREPPEKEDDERCGSKRPEALYLYERVK